MKAITIDVDRKLITYASRLKEARKQKLTLFLKKSRAPITSHECDQHSIGIPRIPHPHFSSGYMFAKDRKLAG